MNALVNNKKQITNFLINQSDWVSSSEISLNTAIAERKIKYAINRINMEYGNIIQSSKKGYFIETKDIEQAKQVFEGENEVPGNYEERKKYIIIKLLMGKQELNIDTLTRSLYVTKNVLLNELSRIRKELKPYHIAIQTKNNVVALTGESADKKKLILDYLNKDLETSFFCVDNIQAFFEDIDLYVLKGIVSTALSEYGYYIDNYSLINYIINLALLILFGKTRNSVTEDRVLNKTLQDSVPMPMRDIVNNIYSRTKEAYAGYQFSEKDFYEISIEILTRLVPKAVDSMRIDDTDALLGEDTKAFMDKIFRSVYKTYEIDLRSEIFFTRFSYHIKNLLTRVEQDIDVNMHMSGSIKRTYPMVYAIAVHIANLICPEKDRTISEEEIALIALYIGTIIEEKKSLDEKLSCIIITPDYYVVRESIIKNFRDVLGKYIYIRDIVSDTNEIEAFNDYDLVLSTTPLDVTFSIPFLLINPIMTDEDRKNILKYVDVAKKVKEKKVIRTKISHFFHEDIFFTDTSFKTSREVIEYVCDFMVSKQYVDSDFKEKIYEHEEISSSDYGFVAITHPLDNDCNHSAISVLIQKDPIKWGRNDVNIVFIFSLRDIDGDLFRNVFGLILDLITDKQHYDKLLEIKDFNQFVDMILENR
jgi:lichenan operon transcriptional antiterminator